ncbi:peptidoglycan-binding protein, partial [Sulfurovum sp.]|uniref:peptidoglycan-binding domain-containing protein n=1 Tax=Sulfurovum sp. TaxID=1969726 RepID=UPI003568E69C
MKKINSVSSLLMGSLLVGNIAYADFADGLVGGLVGGAVGSVITNEVYKSNQPQPAPAANQQQKQAKQQTRYVAPQNTDQMKIQKALASLGFYRGKLDGEVNSFETRSAIREMNKAYEISDNASLKPEAKDALIFLGTLFEFDRYLISSDTDKRSKGKKIQTALKIHGFYFSKIDGVVGSGTRNSIAQYKASKGLSSGGSLDFEEEYQLVSSAKAMNDKNIEDTIGSLKGLGAKQEAPTQMIKMQPVKS